MLDAIPGSRPSRRLRFCRPRALFPAIGLIAAAIAPADAGSRAFLDAAACREAKALSDAECDVAYANAKAEFDEKAPRFSARADCERFFRRCMIGDIEAGGRRVVFIPQMRGFAIVDGRERQVVPVAEGGGAEASFQPRAARRPDASVSAARRAEAQDAWKRMVAAPAPSFDHGDVDTAPPSDVGPLRAYPLTPAMLQDLKNRERAYGAAPSP